MHPTYTVQLLSSKKIREIPGDWTTKDYLQILELTEYGDTAELSPADAEEMAKMSLADMPKDEAALLLLNYIFPEGTLTKGQLENCAQEMDTESLWEEYPEPDKHRQFFRAASLLYDAFNGGFPKPEACRLELRITSVKTAGRTFLNDPEAAFLLRLLAAGMDGHALLHRLFEKELTGSSFPSAPFIIWETSVVIDGDDHLITVTSSDYWLEAYNPVAVYETKAWEDEVPEED
ncbi:hypothetical protein [Neolewinella persica]|uniref:hypothetical protein n=1 Tax=Neolewinella persica TaxID=70998 RepID=UPI0003727186|nr:hypothetical protein [Neolewinella persica]